MGVVKKYKVLLVLALAIIAGIFFFFSHLYTSDVKALEDFSASYKTFDKAISDFSTNKTDDLQSQASDAVAELNAKANFRLSSLIKNDGVIPPLALEIAGLSEKELNTLSAYKRAVQTKDTGSDELGKEYNNLASKRKAAYAHFQELAR